MGTVVSGVQHCACLIREDGKRIIFLRGTYHAAALAYIPMVLRRSRFLRFTASFDRNCHWTDLAVFSLLCIPLDAVNERMPWTFPLWLQAVLGGIVLIVSQLTAGLVFNVWLGLGLWDYTSLFGNFLGQICPRYALLWLLLAGPLLMLCDRIGFRSGGPWPHYKLI